MSYVKFLFDPSCNRIVCAHCSADLHDEKERAIANTKGGIKYFCKAPEENPQDSCYNMWRRFHR